MTSHDSIHVVIDTSVLRQSPPTHAALEHLAAAARLKRVTLHVPELVVGEVVGGLADDLRIHHKYLAHLKRAVEWSLEHPRQAQLLKAIASVQAYADACEQHITAGLGNWLTASKAVADRVSDADTRRVFTQYFAGEAPFGGRRQRKDIPDAFIYDGVRRLSDEGKTICVVVADKALAASLATLKSVSVFTDVHELLTSKPFRSAVAGAESTVLDSVWLGKTLERLKGARRAVQRLAAIAVQDAVRNAEVTGSLPSDNSDAVLGDCGDLDITEVKWETSARTGDHEFSVSVLAHTDAAYLELFIHKADYWSLGSGYDLIDADWNDHYVFASTERPLDIEAVVEIQLTSAHKGALRVAAVEFLKFNEITIGNASR